MPFFMDDISNLIKQHSGNQDQTYGFLRHCKIVEYDPKKNRVKCAHYDPATENWTLITNWMPWVQPALGQGGNAESGRLWGQVTGPCVGEMCFMIPHQGDHNNGVVIGSTYTDTRPPPTVDSAYTKAGEWLYKHASGSYIKFFENGDVTIFAAGNLNFHAEKNMNTHVVGSITTGAEKKQTLTGSSILLNASSQIIENAPAVDTTQNFSAGNGATGSFSTSTGTVVSVQDGIITNIY